ncbi:MAG: glycosyltransferase [Leptolyngbyaceae bacterium]|nr:glycosyltransferase [Leptolyngbyaceae bacterium]
MRILHVISSVNPQGGGPIEVVKQLGHINSSYGRSVEVVCLDPPDAPWLQDFPFKLYALGPGISNYRYSKYLIPWMRQNATHYDAVILNGIWQYSSFGTWLALRSFPKNQVPPPYFVFTHGMLDPWFKYTYPLKHLKKWLYWPWGEYRVLRDAQAVLFTCEEEKLLARQSFWLYQCKEVVVNYGTTKPNGNSEAQRQLFLEQFPHLRSKRLLLFLSRIHVKKGCDLLIEAFARVVGSDDSLHLVIAGPDQTGWKTTLQRQAKHLGIEQKITWTGMLSGDVKWGAYHAAEVFVLPSHQENFGIAVAEAMACGVPVLISNKVNIWREIEADGAGLVANDDLTGTIELLQKWLRMLPNAQQAMRHNAKQCFVERFEAHQAVQSLIDVLLANGVTL